MQLDNVLVKHVTAQGSDNYITYAKVPRRGLGGPFVQAGLLYWGTGSSAQALLGRHAGYGMFCNEVLLLMTTAGC
jgi:hypothetical protein